MKLFVCLVLFLLFIPIVIAKEYHLPLLAVKETEGGFKGSTADLYLEVKEGRGRVFLETYPLTKLDTQMSTRFAKEIACSELDYDCNKFDFIYTIKSSSVIVGGPSAGAAITLVTIAALEDLDINNNITITGTINSGGLIGPVGGLKEKIEAASDVGIKKVLIPNGEIVVEEGNISVLDENSNESEKNISKINLFDYGKKLGIDVIEISTVKEALVYMTGKNIQDSNNSLEIDKKYLETMKSVTEDLCRRSKDLIDKTAKINLTKYEKDIFENSLNLTERSKKAFESEKYYSAASYCFGANTKLSYLILKNSSLTNTQILDKITEVKSSIKKKDLELENKTIRTITDLETYMIVKERLNEAEESINKVLELKNLTEKIENIAYSVERLNSADSWSSFFDKGTKEYSINSDQIKDSCINKIYEAEERNEYLKLLTEIALESTQMDIDAAKKDFENKSYELCLFKASKAKAESDVILNTLGTEESDLKETTEKRLEVIRNNIIKEQKKGIFPVVGYSYYEYADDLKDNDIYSSMLFTEYSLELSNLDIYFKKDGKNVNFMLILEKNIMKTVIFAFSLGILIGINIGKINSKNHRK
jgi:uncharacterized protein